MNIHQHIVNNGLDILLVDTKSFPSMTTLLLVGSGSRYEDRKNNGIAHFFEHMVFKGSKKYPSTLLLSSLVEGFGGYFNAFTGKDYTGYYVKSPSKHYKTVIEIIADMIQHPLLKTAEIEKEKGVIVQEIKMYEDTPQRMVFDIYEELLYKNHPLGYYITGTVDTVTAFTRDTFTNYINRLYRPNNATFIIAGGLTSKNGANIEDYRAKMQKEFGQWESGKTASFEKIKERQESPQALVRYKKSEQAHMCLGYRTFSWWDERRYILWVLTAILGIGMSSRLFIEVREKRGLCYSIGTYYDYFTDAGNMLTYAGVSTDVNSVRETVKVILDEHNKIMEKGIKGISDKELRRAKELIKGNFLLSLEDTYNVASLFGKQVLLEGKMTEVKEILRDIESVTKEQIIELAKEIFTKNNLNFALIGPFKKTETFLDILLK